MLNRRKKKDLKQEEADKLAELHSKTEARLNRISGVEQTKAPIATPLEGTDNRRIKRMIADYPAIVICEEEHDTPAMIADYSEEGMRLRFATPQNLPDTLVIDSPAFTNFIVADIVWRNGTEIGLSIDREWTNKLAEPLDAMAIEELETFD